MQKLLFLLFLFPSFILFGQTKKDSLKVAPIVFFETPLDLISNKYSPIKGNAIIKKEGEGYLKIKKVTNSNGSKISRWTKNWGIEYEGNRYLHLYYCDGFSSLQNVYMKLDVIGKYSLVFLDAKTPNFINYTKDWNGNTNGGGLINAIEDNSKTWGVFWKDTYNHKNRIILLDTAEINVPDNIKFKYVYAHLLTKQQFKKIVSPRFPNLDTKNISFEKAIECILEMNKEQ